MPACENDAVVSTADGLPNETVPGPLTVVQVVVTAPVRGRPSSVTVPSRLAEAGRTSEASGPAHDRGLVPPGAGPTVTVTSSELCSAPSSPVSFRT